jgi:hypothetical protein
MRIAGEECDPTLKYLVEMQTTNNCISVGRLFGRQPRVKACAELGEKFVISEEVGQACLAASTANGWDCRTARLQLTLEVDFPTAIGNEDCLPISRVPVSYRVLSGMKQEAEEEGESNKGFTAVHAREINRDGSEGEVMEISALRMDMMEEGEKTPFYVEKFHDYNRALVLVQYLGMKALRWQPAKWVMNSLGVQGFFTFFDLMLNSARISNQLKTWPSGSLFGFSTYREAAALEEERLRNV